MFVKKCLLTYAFRLKKKKKLSDTLRFFWHICPIVLEDGTEIV